MNGTKSKLSHRNNGLDNKKFSDSYLLELSNGSIYNLKEKRAFEWLKNEKIVIDDLDNDSKNKIAKYDKLLVKDVKAAISCKLNNLNHLLRMLKNKEIEKYTEKVVNKATGIRLEDFHYFEGYSNLNFEALHKKVDDELTGKTYVQ